MSSQRLLKEIIVPLADYPSIYEDQNLQEAIDIFLSSYRGLPGGLKLQEIVVINSNQEPIGTITIKDVLKGLAPEMLQTKIEHFEGIKTNTSDISILLEEPFFLKCGKTIKHKVYEVYKPFDTYLKETDCILSVLHRMLLMETTLMPVKNGNNISGVVHLEDLFVKVVSICMVGATNSKKSGEV